MEAEIASQPRYVIIRTTDYAYYQPDGTWGEKKTAQSLPYLEACQTRDELEEALGNNLAVVLS